MMDRRIARLERWALRRRRRPRRYVVEYIAGERRWVGADHGDPDADEADTVRVVVEYVRQPLPPGHDHGRVSTPPCSR